MKAKYIIATSLVMLSVILFHNYRRQLFTWSLLRNHVVERKYKKIVQNALNKFNLGEWEPSEFRYINTIENGTVKISTIEVYILKSKNQSAQWNDPEKLIKMKVIIDKQDNLLDVKEFGKIQVIYYDYHLVLSVKQENL
jgi:hypothetical protein